MKAKKILYLGNSSNTTKACHRANALTLLDYELILTDPYIALSSKIQGRLRALLHYRTGYQYIQSSICKWINQTLKSQKKIDLVWVDSGELLGRDALIILKKLKVPIVLFNHDDPTGKRDRYRYTSLRNSLDLYDLVTAVRNDSKRELKYYCHGSVC